MRVRLCVQRHELPEARVLWPIAKETTTISELLEAVNGSVPLESDGWGLDDYIVEVGGFECLHYAQVRGVLADNDEVTIRALKTLEIRARTQSGRYQISFAGAHLIDGIAFGRTYVRRPNRPPVRIPPRKRRRISDYDSQEHEEDFEDDELPKQVSALAETQQLGENTYGITEENTSQRLSIENGTTSTGKRKRTVQFQDDINATPSFGRFDHEDDEDAEDEDFDPSDEESSGLENPLDEDIGKDHEQISPNQPLKESSVDSSSDSSESSEPDSSDSSSDDSDSSSSSSSDYSESSSDSGPEVLASKAPSKSKTAKVHAQIGTLKGSTALGQTIHKVAPGHGKPGTRARNKRRKMHKRLQYLLKIGATSEESEQKLEEEAVIGQSNANAKGKIVEDGLAALSQALREEEDKRDDRVADETKTQQPVMGKKRKLNDGVLAGSKRTSDQISPSASTTAAKGTKYSQDETFQAKRRKLLESIATGGVDINADLLHAPEGEGDPAAFEAAAGTSEPPLVKHPRNKLDVASSRRLLFGSLGLKTPNTKEDEEKLRAKLRETALGSKKATTTKKNVNVEPATAKSADPELWKKKIDLRAVECYHAGIELSIPPFPFVQRWDPQQQFRGKGKNKQKQPATYEEYDETEKPLNYDEELMTIQDESNQVAEQLMHDILADAETDTDTDLPLLPVDMSICDELISHNALPGAVIAFKQLEVSAATNWQPAISTYRTAVIDLVEDNHLLVLTLAQRDRKKQNAKYDDEGNRIYGRFEMPDDDEEDDDDGVVEVPLAELVEAKVIRAGTEVPAQIIVVEETAKPGPPTIVVPDSADPIEYTSKSDDGSTGVAEGSQMNTQAVDDSVFQDDQAAQLPLSISAESCPESSEWIETNA